MAKTVIGVFDAFSEAQHVLQDLLDHGFQQGEISLIAHQEQAAAKPASEWAARTLSIPGIGPVLATGPVAAALAGISGGPAGDSLMKVLTDYGVPADETPWYTGGVRRGGTLVIVETDDAGAERAADIMRCYTMADPEARRSATMEPTRKAEHMTAAEAEASRKGGSSGERPPLSRSRLGDGRAGGPSSMGGTPSRDVGRGQGRRSLCLGQDPRATIAD
jgi:hypothetical protein